MRIETRGRDARARRETIERARSAAARTRASRRRAWTTVRRSSPQALYDETYENYRALREPAAGAGDEALRAARSRCARSGDDDRRSRRARRISISPAGTACSRSATAIRASSPRCASSSNCMALSGSTMFNPLAGPARAAARGDHAGRSADLVLREQRHRGGRRRAQARARRDGAHEDRRDARRLSRQDARRAVGQRARSVSRAVRAAARPTSCTCRSATPTRLARALDGAAAFIVEPMQGEGGVNVPPPGYLHGRARLCDACRRAAHRRRGADRARPLRRAVRVRSRRRRARRHDAGQGAVGRRRPDRRVRRAARACGTPPTARRRCCTRRRSAAARSPARRRWPRSTCCVDDDLGRKRARARRASCWRGARAIAARYPGVDRARSAGAGCWSASS